jgi:hypothetical protein
MELAVSNFFGIRQNMIVPNVSWGLGIHECDLLIVTKSGFASEVEIKISKHDLKKDGEKHHGHRSRLIKRLFFAIPLSLVEFSIYIPARAGILVVRNAEFGNFCELQRPAEINKEATPLTMEQIIHLGRLASMRIWSLKNTIFLKDPCILTYEHVESDRVVMDQQWGQHEQGQNHTCRD